MTPNFSTRLHSDFCHQISSDMVNCLPSDADLGYKHVSPFQSLIIVPPGGKGREGNMVGHGSAFILGVHRAIVFKFPPIYQFLDNFDEVMGKFPIHTEGVPEGSEYGFDTPPEEMARRHRKWKMDDHESIKRGIDHEGEMLDEISSKLRTEKCPHIIQPHLRVPEGLFLPKLQCSLRDRIESSCNLQSFYSGVGSDREITATLPLKIRWTKQLATALAWMERAGLFHGDLRPANVLLDRFDNVVLADFGSGDHTGEYRWTSAEVFCPDEFPICNERSEQYACGWTMYNMFHGSVPASFDISEPSTVVFPSVEGLPFGVVINKSMRLRYASMDLLEQAVLEEYRAIQPWYHRLLDYGCECLGSIYLFCMRTFILRQMKTVYYHLQEAPAPVLDPKVAEEYAKSVQALYH